jgi:hypothetical protein
MSAPVSPVAEQPSRPLPHAGSAPPADEAAISPHDAQEPA